MDFGIDIQLHFENKLKLLQHLINRPGEAEAVPQTPLSIIH